MRVRLRGINWTTKRLANGTVVTHYYAWRGGPRLEGEPGSPEFIASYERAYHERRKPDGDTFKNIIVEFVQSDAFRGLQPRTRADYLKMIRLIEDEFGDLPIPALEERSARHCRHAPVRGRVRAARDQAHHRAHHRFDLSHPRAILRAY